MTPSPVDPLRRRIFSELNLHFSQHGIEKAFLNQVSQQLALLVRFYLNTTSPDPLSISIPLVDVPLLLDGNTVAMAHKIALVVHSEGLSLDRDGCAVYHATSGSVAEGNLLKVSLNGTERKSCDLGEWVVLIEAKGTLGHHRCLISAFSEAAGQVIAGLLHGEERVLEGFEQKGSRRTGPVWDVADW
ncbi:hypothetical protein ACN47E_004962 [Coniothyrium glycines]